MQKLKDEQLLQINGGISAVHIIGLGLAAVATFVASVFYGYINPNKCNN